MKQPTQEIEFDPQGIARFRANQLVKALLDHGSNTGLNLNELTKMQFPVEDWRQFAQLIGYSVSGYGDLSYTDPEEVDQADQEVARMVAVRECGKHL